MTLSANCMKVINRVKITCVMMYKKCITTVFVTDNSDAKITTRYLKQENLPFLRPERKYQLKGFCPVLVAL